MDITELLPIGFYKSGRPIYPIMGGAPTGDDDGTGSSQEDDASDDSNDDADDTGDGGDDDGADDFDSLPEKTKAEIRQLRRDNQRLRRLTKKAPGKPKSDGSGTPGNTHADVLAQVAKLLGIDVPTGNQSAQTIDTDDANDSTAEELRMAKIEVGVVRTASSVGGDADALLDSRSFLAEVADLDPSDPGFTSDLKEAVKAAVRQNPNLRSKKAPGKSGGDLQGGKSKKPVEYTDPQQRLAAAYAASSNS